MREASSRLLAGLVTLLATCSVAGCTGFEFGCPNTGPCGPPPPTSHDFYGFSPEGLTARPLLGEPLTFQASHAVYHNGLGPDESYLAVFDPGAAIRLTDEAGAEVGGTTAASAGRLEFRPAAPLHPGGSYTAWISAHGTWSGSSDGTLGTSYAASYSLEVWNTAPLDPAYGDGGIAVVHGFAASTSALDQLGGIVLGGPMPGGAFGSTVAIRLDARGEVVPGFGASGRVAIESQLPTGSAQPRPQQCLLALDAAARVVATCAARSPSGASSWLALRLDDAGLLDPSFGLGGVARGDLILPGEVGPLLARDDGTLVFGIQGFGVDALPSSTLVRLLPDGTLDAAFGGHGVWRAERLLDIEALSGGRLLVASVTRDCPFRVARYGVTGAPDPAYGTDGAVCLPGEVSATALDGADRLLVLRNLSGLERLTPGGALDTTFGTAGVVSLPPAWYHAGQLAASADGRVGVQYEGSAYQPGGRPGGVLLIDAAGAVARSVPMPGDFRPVGIAFAADGRLEVTATMGADTLAFRIP